jgi:hypothetical protein
MIATPEAIATDNTGMKRHLPVRTAILEREAGTVFRTDQHDRIAGEAHGQRLPSPQFPGPGHRIPEVGIYTRSPKVGWS